MRIRGLRKELISLCVNSIFQRVIGSGVTKLNEEFKATLVYGQLNEAPSACTRFTLPGLTRVICPKMMCFSDEEILLPTCCCQSVCHLHTFSAFLPSLPPLSLTLPYSPSLSEIFLSHILSYSHNTHTNDNQTNIT